MRVDATGAKKRRINIDIPLADGQELARLAAAAGYDDVERYVADHVLALVRRPGAEALARAPVLRA